VARAWWDARLFEATATNHKHHTLTAGTLELEDRSQHPSQQLATVAAQIASVRFIKLNLFQIRMQAGPFTVGIDQRRRVTKGVVAAGLAAQLHPPQPEAQEEPPFLRLRRKLTPHPTAAAKTMRSTSRFSMRISLNEKVPHLVDN
jgi:hypothetical protein